MLEYIVLFLAVCAAIELFRHSLEQGFLGKAMDWFLDRIWP